MTAQTPFFNTRAAQIAMQSLDRIVKEQIIGMVVARPGRGKTQAINAWRRKCGDSTPHVWIKANVLTRPNVLLAALVQSLGIASTAGRGRTLSATLSRICQELAQKPLLVIVDEADLLNVRTFDLLRSIWDEVSEARGFDCERGFPLALFGDLRLREMLARDDLERLRRRTFLKTELPPLSLKELELIVATKWKDVAFAPEVLPELLQLSTGSFGWVNVIVPLARDLAAKDGRIVTPRILRATRKHLIGAPESSEV